VLEIYRARVISLGNKSFSDDCSIGGQPQRGSMNEVNKWSIQLGVTPVIPNLTKGTHFDEWICEQNSHAGLGSQIGEPVK